MAVVLGVGRMSIYRMAVKYLGNQLNENLKSAEAEWLRISDEEQYKVELFDEPFPIRRIKTLDTTLASLKFGEYEGFDGSKVVDHNVVWINFMTSEKSGDGHGLAEILRALAKKYQFALAGTPMPLKPKKWSESRHFFHRSEEIIQWYKKQLFEVISFRGCTQVWYFPRGVVPEISLDITIKKD